MRLYECIGGRTHGVDKCPTDFPAIAAISGSWLEMGSLTWAVPQSRHIEWQRGALRPLRTLSCSVGNFGAGDGIRTHDPNLGKHGIAMRNADTIGDETERDSTKYDIAGAGSQSSRFRSVSFLIEQFRRISWRGVHGTTRGPRQGLNHKMLL